MTKWHSECFKINNKEIDGLFDTTLNNILMSNYQHIKYKYDKYVKEYNESLKELITAKKNIEQYFVNGNRDIEVKNKLIKEYLEIKKKVKDYARDTKLYKIYYIKYIIEWPTDVMILLKIMSVIFSIKT